MDRCTEKSIPQCSPASMSAGQVLSLRSNAKKTAPPSAVDPPGISFPRKMNRHPSDSDLPVDDPPPTAGPSSPGMLLAACSLRLATCVAMSCFGGLANRAAFSPGRAALMRDFLSCVLENNLVLMALESVVAASARRPNRHSSGHRCRGRGLRRGSSSGKYMLHCVGRTLHRGLVAAVSGAWVVASWGDYVFEFQTRGIIPTMWVIAPGLADPSVYAGVQLRNHRSVFLGGFYRCFLGLCVGAIHAFVAHGLCVRRESSTASKTGSCPSSCRSSQMPCPTRGFYDILCQPKVISWNIAILLALFWHGAWAPLTNLTCCVVGIFVLTPPGEKTRQSSVAAPSLRGALIPDANPPDEWTLRPNVIMIVHESLTGAAMRSTAGTDAAPFFRSLRSGGADFYDFSRARAVAGTTPIGTPGILTGLMPHTEECVDLVRGASLASDFKRRGYDTASFVSYGADWSGGSWSVLTNMLMPGFDAIFDPKSTGDPIMNEHGADDRVMASHFRQWTRTREGPGNSTDPDGGRGRGSERTTNPFFAVIVQNNAHYPHLKHETYSGDPKCEKRKSEDNVTDVEAAQMEEGGGMFGAGDSSDDIAMYSYGGEDGWYNCGFSTVDRYYSSIRTMDESIEAIFDELRKSGQLNNTIIMGAGDHGETPGTMERMGDVNAPILSVPLWMHVPRGLPPDGGVHLRANADRAVSVLDLVPTLRDLVGFDGLYTPDEERECVVGRSLLRRPVPPDRVIMSWQGKPLQTHQIGMFSTETMALIHYVYEPSRTKQVDFTFDPDDVFFNRSEHILTDEPELREKWKFILQESGLLEHNLVKKWMPKLEDLLDRS